jgi:hypothetical protein
MEPIVNGLKEEYSDDVDFVSLNAKDGKNGETIFQQLGLPGHPSIVIYTKDGEEVYRQFGIVDDLNLIDKLNEILD